MALQEEIDAKRLEIHTEGYPMSLGEIINLYRDKELDIHPEFQRFFRWTITQKSRFIESILLGIPIPSVFVNQREDGVWDVIDGLQRLSTIFEFVGVLRDQDENPISPSRLKGTDYLPSLAGKSWEADTPGEEADASGESLTSAQRLLLKRAALDIKIIKRESDPDAQLDLFQRLNTGGSQLSDQELRNSLLIMVEPGFYYWLRELQAFEPFQVAIAASDRALDEQYDVELIIRFLAVKNADEEGLRSVGDMADFLTTSSVGMARDPAFDRTREAGVFRKTFTLIADGLGDDAFKRYDAERHRFMGGFSISAYEAIAIGVATHGQEWEGMLGSERSTALADRARALSVDPLFRANSGSGVRASSRIPQIIPRGRELFVP